MFHVQVSSCKHTIVIYEITLSMLRLVRTHSHSLQSMEWDLVYDIISNIKDHVKNLTTFNKDNENQFMQVSQCIMYMYLNVNN